VSAGHRIRMFIAFRVAAIGNGCHRPGIARDMPPMPQISAAFGACLLVVAQGLSV
jgi:hypothetical protein